MILYQGHREMKGMQTMTTIRINADGDVLIETGKAEGVPEDMENRRTDVTEIRQITQEEEERFAVVSDLSDVCEYLEDSEVIKIRLIIQKAAARKERKEGE